MILIGFPRTACGIKNQPCAASIVYLSIAWLLASCSPSVPITKSEAFRAGSVTQLLFSIDQDNRAIRDEAFWQKVSEKISHRFHQAGYPVMERDSPIGQKAEISHLLAAELRPKQVKAIPPGFTLSFGNADPRSQSFQKTTVLPITCKLERLEDRTIVGSVSQDVVYHEDFAQSSDGGRNQSEQAFAFYVSAIGSTCHTLLNRLSISPSDAIKAPVKPIAPTPRLERGDTGEPDGTAPPLLQEIRVPPAEPPSTLKPDTEKNDSLFDKPLKIYNQGDTVILEFGPKRR